jgi:membrane protein
VPGSAPARGREGGTPRIDRKRVLRTLTFWLRPAFALRVVNRFQKIAGFDRAVALASSGLTAMIPLALVVGAVAQRVGGKDLADRIIDRYDLSGGGAEAVKDIFSPAGGTSTSIGLLGVLLLLVAVLSFTRAMQRLFEQAWELKPLSVRNTLNGLKWIGALLLFVVGSGWVHGLIGDGQLDLVPTLLLAPVTMVFYVWSGWVLSAQRIAWRDLIPFGAVSAVALTIYGIGAAVYVPHLFSSYATRYGVIGAVFAMISTLFCVMVVVVAAAALGREVHDELGRIRRGEQPPDDAVRREWDALVAEGRSRWDVAREQIAARRRRKKEEAQAP